MTEYMMDLGFDINAVQAQGSPNLQYGFSMLQGNFVCASLVNLNINDTLACNAFDVTGNSQNGLVVSGYSVVGATFTFTNADAFSGATVGTKNLYPFDSTKLIQLCEGQTTKAIIGSSSVSFSTSSVASNNFPGRIDGQNTSVIFAPSSVNTVFPSWQVIPAPGIAATNTGRFLFTVTLTVAKAGSPPLSFVADPEMIVGGFG